MINEKMIIEVACMVAFDELELDDQDESGNCAIDGSYRLAVIHNGLTDSDLKEKALDKFHSTVPISCLEDFVITCRKQLRAEEVLGEGNFRADLGSLKIT